MFLPAFTSLLMTQSFNHIRVGDVDGFGYLTGTTPGAIGPFGQEPAWPFGSWKTGIFGCSATPFHLTNAIGSPINNDGVGILTGGDYLPDLDCSGSTAYDSDEFNNQGPLEQVDGLVQTLGCSNLASTGSVYTDIALSPNGTGWLDGSLAPLGTPYGVSPSFQFDYFVANGDLTPGQNVFVNVVFADYDVVPAELIYTDRFGSSTTAYLTTQDNGLGDDGQIQKATAVLPFGFVYQSVAGGWSGVISVRLNAPNEPFIAVDYLEIAIDPLVLPEGCCCWIDENGTQIQSVMQEEHCLDLGGTYAGDGVPCEEFLCQPVTGACCFLKDFGVMWCHDNYTASDCASLPLSTFYPGQNCGDIPCPMDPILGACCYEDADLGWNCVETEEIQCLENFGGTWYVGQPCSWIQCPSVPLTGACCFFDPQVGSLTCLDTVDEFKCLEVYSGTWYPGQTCSDVAEKCMDPRGACCFHNPDTGSYDCLDGVTEFQCEVYYSGNWTAGATCSEVDCCPKLGACCVKGVCVPTTLEGCDLAEGSWSGVGVLCDQVTCAEPCVFDVTGDGLVNFSDLIAIINNWGLVCP